MKKVIIWGTGRDYQILWTTFQYFEIEKKMEIVAVTSKDAFLRRVDQYLFVNSKSLMDIEFDFLLVCSREYYSAIREEAISLGIDEKKIISAFLLRIPEFDFDRYIKLKESNLSIISNLCWGTFLYHYLGLRFNTPFINMWESPDDFLGIVGDLKNVIELPLVRCDERSYPVFTLGGYKLHFSHDDNYKIAEENWNRRKGRINWDNILVMMHSDNLAQAEKFERLPYAKKICFVPFETDLPSCFYVPCAEEVPLPHALLKSAQGEYLRYYDIWDLLVDGKITRII